MQMILSWIVLIFQIDICCAQGTLATQQATMEPPLLILPNCFIQIGYSSHNFYIKIFKICIKNKVLANPQW